MAGGATGQPQKMREFVSRLFQRSPDFSMLTYATIRKKYLDHVGLEKLSKLQTEQLKQLVEEELVRMKVDQPPSNVDLRTEAQDSFKSGDRKRPSHTSHSSEKKIKNEQEHKRQKIENILEISSDEKDSEIDSKKRPCHRSQLLRNVLDSSDQGDSRAGDHNAHSETDEEITKSKRKPSLQEARGKRGRGSKSAKGQGNRGLQKRVVSDSEEAPDMGQSDLEEEVKIPRKPKEREGRKNMQRKDSSGKKPEEEKKMTQRIQESTSEESESESNKHKSSKEETKRAQDPTSSEGESQSEMNQGQPGKAALISLSSESESDESNNGDPRGKLEKKSKPVSECDSSQGEEKLKKRGAPKSQKKSIGKTISVLRSENLVSEFVEKKTTQNPQQKRTKKLKRKSAAKEKEGEESSKEEGSGSEEDEPSTSHHPGKDKHSGKNKDLPTIQRLKHFIRECGAWRNYKKLLADCHSDKAQIEVLKEQLKGLGMKGTPSLAKCKAIKKKREDEAEMASLDINNIIASEGRPKRRNVWSLYSKPQYIPSSPKKPIDGHPVTDWSHLQGVISSERESS
ncbi:HIRA-interacting protein 3 [Protobothrops mucrosquamatus]|uniref:HIRA-interacting protein 3 n=1 Tax=Protobothrops mucrosquamatus TaxID=103944 RepID=UPI0010FBA0A4|nr:HIRA-interacting protein 3 [Protobothrops mucrosquamatus]